MKFFGWCTIIWENKDNAKTTTYQLRKKLTNWTILRKNTEKNVLDLVYLFPVFIFNWKRKFDNNRNKHLKLLCFFPYWINLPSCQWSFLPFITMSSEVYLPSGHAVHSLSMSSLWLFRSYHWQQHLSTNGLFNGL